GEQQPNKWSSRRRVTIHQKLTVHLFFTYEPKALAMPEPNDSPAGSLMNPRTIVRLLSAMMFLQFFAWGAWFATMSAAMDAKLLGVFIGDAYAAAPIAAIFAPLFLGLVADRFFPSEKVMGSLMLVGGVIMCAIALIAPQGADKGGLIVWLMIAYMLCYMPTLGLGNTITVTPLAREAF